MAVLDMIAMSLWAKYVYRLRFYPSVRLSSCQKKKEKWLCSATISVPLFPDRLFVFICLMPV